MKKEKDFLNGNILKLYTAFLIPSVLSLLLVTFTALVDEIILSYYLGNLMLSSVSLAMPIFLLINAIGAMIGAGGATVYANYIGKEDKKSANKYFTISMLLGLVIGIVMSVIMGIFIKQLVWGLGANDIIFNSTMQYVKVVVNFLPVLAIYCVISFFVRYDKDPNLVLIGTAVCSIANIVLDILFVGFLNMGPMGAALATCLSYALCLLTLLLHFLKKSNTLKLDFKDLHKSMIKRLAKAGTSVSLTHFGAVITTMVFNIVLMKTAGENIVSIYAVITQLSLIALAFYDGSAAAAQPIISVNFGAKNNDRIKKVIKLGITVDLALCLICMLCYQIFASQITEMFSISDIALKTEFIYAIRVYSLSIPLSAINVFTMYYFQAREKFIPSTLISLSYSSVFMILGLFINIAIFGSKGVWLSYTLAQILSMLVSFIFLKLEKKNTVKQ